MPLRQMDCPLRRCCKRPTYDSSRGRQPPKGPGQKSNQVPGLYRSGCRWRTNEEQGPPDHPTEPPADPGVPAGGCWSMPLFPSSKSGVLWCSGSDQRWMDRRSLSGNRSQQPMKSKDLQTKQKNRMAILVSLLAVAALCRLVLLPHF